MRFRGGIIDPISHPDIKFPWYTWQEKRRFCCVFSQKERHRLPPIYHVLHSKRKTLIIKDKISRIEKSVFLMGEIKKKYLEWGEL